MKKPLQILLFMAVAVTGFSCKKLVEDQKKNLLVQAMTSGKWHIETYQEGSASITDEFTGYSFQFYDNGVVEGRRDSLVQKGTWVGDIQNLSITSQFPSAQDVLLKLNGTWKIIDSEMDYVSAEMPTSQGTNILHLRKNP